MRLIFFGISANLGGNTVELSSLVLHILRDKGFFVFWGYAMDKEKLKKTLKNIGICPLIYFAALLLSTLLFPINNGGLVFPVKVILLCAGSVFMTYKTGGVMLCPTVSLAAGIISAVRTADMLMEVLTMENPSEGFEQFLAMLGIVGGGLLSAAAAAAMILTSILAFLLMMLSSFIARKIFIKKGILPK